MNRFGDNDIQRFIKFLLKTFKKICLQNKIIIKFGVSKDDESRT